jgi:hypothetical protein
MTPRALLVALLVTSTVAFVVGVSIERSSGDEHDEQPAAAGSSEAAEGGDEHAAESEGEPGAAEPASAESDEDDEETLFGIDLEATPFVVLAAAFSLALALGVWLRPRWTPLLATVGVAMVVFAALDVREVLHQLDESNGGLAVLAGTVAALHLAAAAVATRLSARAPQAP